MWCINTHILGTCILWIIAVVAFTMMIILTVAFTNIQYDVRRLNLFYRELEYKVSALKSEVACIEADKEKRG